MIALELDDDALVEADETFTVTLSSPAERGRDHRGEQQRRGRGHG